MKKIFFSFFFEEKFFKKFLKKCKMKNQKETRC